MPVCFQLYKKDGAQEGPVVLNRIDEEMCEHFKVPVDPIKFFHRWFDCVGLRLALGKSFDEIRAEFNGYLQEEQERKCEDGVKDLETAIAIVDWLDERYTPNAFYSPYKD